MASEKINAFNTAKHTAVKSEDGSYTAYSKEYDEHYHSTKDGALHESLSKHVIPSFERFDTPKSLTILDICFGLGFNTLATLHYIASEKLDTKVAIYSPELDGELVRSLEDFTYPDIFQPYLHIIKSIVKTGKYEDENIYIEVFIGDARTFVKNTSIQFDIVYQDAFSPSVNPLLWTEEYFKDIARLIKDEGVLSTYSIALPIRMALFKNGFHLYLYHAQNCRASTLASKSLQKDLEWVDVAHKMACNPDIVTLRDV